MRNGAERRPSGFSLVKRIFRQNHYPKEENNSYRIGDRSLELSLAIVFDDFAMNPKSPPRGGPGFVT